MRLALCSRPTKKQPVLIMKSTSQVLRSTNSSTWCNKSRTRSCPTIKLQLVGVKEVMMDLQLSRRMDPWCTTYRGISCRVPELKKEWSAFHRILRYWISWDFLKNTDANAKRKVTTLRPEKLPLSLTSYWKRKLRDREIIFVQHKNTNYLILKQPRKHSSLNSHKLGITTWATMRPLPISL